VPNPVGFIQRAVRPQSTAVPPALTDDIDPHRAAALYFGLNDEVAWAAIKDLILGGATVLDGGGGGVSQLALDAAIDDIPEFATSDPTKVPYATTGEGAEKVMTVNVDNLQYLVLDDYLDVDDSGVVSSITPKDILTVPVLANRKYKVDGMLVYEAAGTGAGGADCRLSFGVPASSTGVWGGIGPRSGASTSTESVLMDARSWAQTILFGGIGAGSSLIAKFHGRLHTTTSGDFVVRYTQGVSDPTATIAKAHTFVTLTPLG
jgi:hypothetical protein